MILVNALDGTSPCQEDDIDYATISKNNGPALKAAGADSAYSCWVADASDISHKND